ncbi:MAG: alpha/beta hydrolase [Cytophagales bacterium]
MEFQIKEENGFRYIDKGEGDVLLLLHGLFGALSNWAGVIRHFSKEYRVVIPMLPIYEMPIKEANLDGLVEYVESFLAMMNIREMTILGNSLGGHISLIYTLKNPQVVKALILTGSSGLFENGMGGSYPKRGSYEFVRQKVEYTFYDPKTATKDLVDEVFNITNDIPKCMRIVSIAKSAQRHNMAKEVKKIKIPVLLVWGLNDTITPPEVAHEFKKLIENSELRFIDKCGHAPMMEHPELFNNYVTEFLSEKLKLQLA